MNNNKQHIDFYNLTAKYLAGEATDKEVKLLENWVKTSEGNKKLFRDYKQAWKLSHSAKIDFDTADAWKKVEETLFEKETGPVVIPIETKKPQWNMALRIAASIVIFISIGFVFYYFNEKSAQTELMTANETKTEVLSDGSEITLNLNSSLTYSGRFNKKERRLKLEGDAFFDVARNEEKPFIIETDKVTVKVLGTSFYVNARKNNPEVSVTVNSGKVEVISANNKKIVLVAGETGTFNKRKKRLAKNANTDKNYIAWKTKRMIFQDTPLAEVVEVLQETYHVEIQIANSEIGQCELTSTFNQLNLSDVFEILRETFPTISITKTGNTYTLSGSECEE